LKDKVHPAIASSRESAGDSGRCSPSFKLFTIERFSVNFFMEKIEISKARRMALTRAGFL